MNKLQIPRFINQKIWEYRLINLSFLSYLTANGVFNRIDRKKQIIPLKSVGYITTLGRLSEILPEFMEEIEKNILSEIQTRITFEEHNDIKKCIEKGMINILTENTGNKFIIFSRPEVVWKAERTDIDLDPNSRGFGTSYFQRLIEYVSQLHGWEQINLLDDGVLLFTTPFKDKNRQIKNYELIGDFSVFDIENGEYMLTFEYSFEIYDKNGIILKRYIE